MHKKDSMKAINSINSTSSENILITGSCGFIGVNLADFLIKKGIPSLRMLDNLSVGKLEYLESMLSSHGKVTKSCVRDKKIIYLLDILNKQTEQTNQISQKIEADLTIGDIRDKETCLEATRGMDTIVHLAAHAGIIPSIENPYYDFEVNVLGTLNLLYAAVHNKVAKFILASSNAPLGNQDPPLNEEKIPKPLSPYGASKLACEAYCSAFYNSYGLKTVSLRFSNAYGPYSLHKNSVIAKFIRDVLRKEALIIYGDGTQTRDFIHVHDLCHIIHLLIASRSSAPTNNIWGQTFHLGTGKETSIIHLADYIRSLSEDNVKIAFEPPRKGEIKKNYSDISKAKTILGLEQLIDLRDGIRKVYEWFMNQRIEDVRKTNVFSGDE